MEDMEIEKGRIFTIEKGNRKMRWKIIDHPFFDNVFAVVRDYNGMMSYDKKSDIDHIVHGSITMEKAVQATYDMT